MVDAMDPPNQVSYEEICTYIGKLYLESHYEVDRLKSMLMQLQIKFTDEYNSKLKLEADLAEAMSKLTMLEAAKNGPNL
jgi:hypothetical protein